MISINNNLNTLFYDLRIYNKFFIGAYGIGQDVYNAPFGNPLLIKRFDPKLQIGEDTKFNADVFKLDKHKKCYVKEAMYCYKLGLNKNSLTMLFSAKKIEEKRCKTCQKKKI